MSIPVVVIGGGGFGRETLDVLEAVNRSQSEPAFDVLGVVDSSLSDINRARLAARAVPVLGTLADWLDSDSRAAYLIAVGNPEARRTLDETLRGAGRSAATVVHPSAQIGSQTRMGEGTVICGGVQVSTNVALGRHVHLNPHATIGHDSVLGDFTSINPAATISGEVSVGHGVLVGANAVVLQGLAIGAGAVVGAAACVVRDVAGGATVKGVPAR